MALRTMKTKIAIACQGGGSQAAFTAGALQALFEAGIADRFEITALSGTSGGAGGLNAADRRTRARVAAEDDGKTAG
ncbi:MAG: hypothetical protein WAL67_16230 [Candidatus Cybelea sp.]